MQSIIFMILATASTNAISWETIGLKGGRRLQFDTSTTTASPSESTAATTAAPDSSTTVADAGMNETTTVAPGNETTGAGAGMNETTTVAPGNETTGAGAGMNETTTVAPGNETTVAGAGMNETTTVAPGNETTGAGVIGNETTTVAPSSNETTTAIPTSNVTVVIVNGTNETTVTNGTTVQVNVTNIPVESSFDFNSFAAAYMLNDMSDPDCTSSCCQCISNTSAVMVSNSTAALLEQCAGAPDRALLSICGYLLSQQNISLGMIMGFGDVVQMSNAYCVGAGSCPEPVNTLSDVCASNSSASFSYGDMPDLYLLGQSYGISGLQFSYDQCLLMTSLQVMETNTRLDNAQCAFILASNSSSSSASNVTSSDNVTSDSNTTTESTTMNGVAAVSSFCPYQVRACEWKQANQDLAWGLRWSDISPFKFSRGYCAGVGQ